MATLCLWLLYFMLLAATLTVVVHAVGGYIMTVVVYVVGDYIMTVVVHVVGGYTIMIFVVHVVGGYTDCCSSCCR